MPNLYQPLAPPDSDDFSRPGPVSPGGAGAAGAAGTCRQAWRSDRDDYGTSLLSAFQESEGNIVLAVALQGAKTYWLGNYRLNPDRYAFIRQQFFFLLGERMEPWQSGALPHGSPFRGRVYRKPKKK